MGRIIRPDSTRLASSSGSRAQAVAAASTICSTFRVFMVLSRLFVICTFMTFPSTQITGTVTKA
ncbi:hypothetical protein D3C73_1238300 [compost metagenome]